LGPDYGKELRRLLLALEPTSWKMIVMNDTPPPTGQYDVCLLFGSSPEHAQQWLNGRTEKTFIIHPTTRPTPESLAHRKVCLILPELDFFGQGTPWKRLAVKEQWPTLVSQGAALDIRPAWPSVILPQLETGDDPPQP
jgi:hypothetical protein